MGGFAVDTASVKQFGDDISRICSDLASAATPDGLSQSDTGRSAVTSALREFHEHWSAQQDKILQNLTSLSKAIRDAAAGYDSSDSSIANAANGSRTT